MPNSFVIRLHFCGGIFSESASAALAAARFFLAASRERTGRLLDRRTMT